MRRLTRARGVGLGKLILCGEHAVVYGHPALAFAVDRHTEVQLEAAPGDLALDASTVASPRLLPALRTLLPARGVRVRITSNLPIGRGMGSSAALAVATVRARARLEGSNPDGPELFERAMPMERFFHGNPSGLDVAVAARGGMLRYRRGPPPTITSVDTRLSGSVIVLDTGVSADTSALVAAVAARRPAIDPILDRIGALVAEAEACLDDVVGLGTLLTENHRRLAEIGVSTPDLDALVDLALAAGAEGAKLSGAGGGGVVLAIADAAEPVLDAARRAGVDAFACVVGQC